MATPQAIQRLLDLEEGFSRFPGRAPGGSGATGIGRASNIGHAPSGGLLSRQDASDYDRMVREQLEYTQLANPGEQIRVRHDTQPQALAIDALLGGEPYTGSVNPAWTDSMGMTDAIQRKTGTGRYAESHEQFKKRYGR